MQTILHITLALHLIALTIAIGITLANAVASIQCWKLYDKNKEQGIAAFRAISKFQLFGILGLSLLIFTGLVLLWLFDWTLVELQWFKIKLGIVVLLFVNGFTMGRSTSSQLGKLLSEEIRPGEGLPETKSLRRNMLIFQATQLSLFVLIIILVVFR